MRKLLSVLMCLLLVALFSVNGFAQVETSTMSAENPNDIVIEMKWNGEAPYAMTTASTTLPVACDFQLLDRNPNSFVKVWYDGNTVNLGTEYYYWEKAGKPSEAWLYVIVIGGSGDNVYRITLKFPPL